jgi:hypothetical protein
VTIRYPGRALGALALLAFWAFMVGAGPIRCSFALLFHQPCPGCGTTRSVFGLLRGDWHAAVHFNLLGLLATPLLAAFAAFALWRIAREGGLHAFGRIGVERWLTRAFALLLALQVVVWIARFFGAFGGPVPV